MNEVPLKRNTQYPLDIWKYYLDDNAIEKNKEIHSLKIQGVKLKMLNIIVKCKCKNVDVSTMEVH